MSSFDPWVYASCVPFSPQVINTVFGRTCPPSTSLSVWYSPSWTLRVRLNIDTPPLVGITFEITCSHLRSALFSMLYRLDDHIRGRLLSFVSTHRFNNLHAVFISLEDFYYGWS